MDIGSNGRFWKTGKADKGLSGNMYFLTALVSARRCLLWSVLRRRMEHMGREKEGQMKTRILQTLKETEGYVSGQELCDRLGISRTAVWKYMKKLKEEGYQIEAVPNKGYQLLLVPDVLTESEMKSRLITKWAGREISCYEKVDSTNHAAKNAAEQGGLHGALFLAEQQTAGKGRRGRGWISPSGTGIWMTILLRPQFEPSCASMLTLVAALSVSKAIEKETGLFAPIKWPNDITVNGKKVCGILTEMSAEMEWIHYVVIGIGINVNIEEFPKELQDTATSLKRECGREVERAPLISTFLSEFEHDYETFMESQNLSGLMKQYNQRLVNCEREVRILDPLGEYTGIAEGIDMQGALLVRKGKGEIVRITSGEVSVRGIYGYV